MVPQHMPERRFLAFLPGPRFNLLHISADFSRIGSGVCQEIFQSAVSSMGKERTVWISTRDGTIFAEGNGQYGSAAPGMALIRKIPIERLQGELFCVHLGYKSAQDSPTHTERML